MSEKQDTSLVVVVNKLFAGKTPKQFVKTRPGPGGLTIKYVEIGYVINELNKAFGPFWEFKVVDKGIGEKQIWVQGQLTVKDPKAGFSVTKETFGGSDIKISSKTNLPIDIANDLKAAVSDCTKKAASMFGIAADVFFKEQDKYDQMDNEVDDEEGMVKSSFKIVNDKFFAVASERGIDSEKAKEWIKSLFKVEHMDELVVGQLEKAILALQENYKVVGKDNSPEKIKSEPIEPEQPTDGPVVDETIKEEYFCQGSKHKAETGKYLTTFDEPWCPDPACKEEFYPKKVPSRFEEATGKKKDAEATNPFT